MAPRTLEELDAVRASCRKLVMTRSAASAAISVIPIAGPDILADVGMLMEMVPVINRRFGLSPEQIEELPPQLQGAVMGTASRLGSALIGKAITKELLIAVLKRVGVRITAATAAKFIPFLGSAVAAGISFTAMRLLGNRHVEDCYTVARSLIEEERLSKPETELVRLQAPM